MRKTFYSGLLVVVVGLTGMWVSAASAGDDVVAFTNAPIVRVVTAGERTGDQDVVVAVSDIVPPAVAGLPAVPAIRRSLTAAIDGRDTVVLGSSGGTELLGGAFGIVLLLRYVRRRRLV